MRASQMLPILGALFAHRVLADDAPAVNDNPIDAEYEAVPPAEPFTEDPTLEGNVKGFINAIARSDGKGVRFHVKFENLPKEGGPFTYHIHTDKVVDGNCTVTKKHLDPYNAGVEVPCDAENPASCEVGDLAGKHGKITSDPFEVWYTDLYASTKEGDEAFFGDRSFVLHYADSTRLTCANFELKPAPAAPDYGSGECDSVTPEPLPEPTEVIIPPGQSDGVVTPVPLPEPTKVDVPPGQSYEGVTPVPLPEPTEVIIPPTEGEQPGDGGEATPSPGGPEISQVPISGATAQTLSLPMLFLAVAGAYFTL